MKLLQIDSSARGASVSRAMTRAFVDAWREVNPATQIKHRDLRSLPAATVTDEWVAARDADPAQRSDAHRDVLKLSDELIDELHAADVVVLGSPMYNFNISAPLKTWVDLVVRQGRTVDFHVRPPKGLLQGKKLVVVTARGGAYGAGSPTAAFDFQEPYLRHILSLIGFKDVTFIHADRQLYGEEAAASSREEARQRIGQVVEDLLKEAA